MLAGVLPAPSRYAPNRNPEAAQQRAGAGARRDARRGLHHRRRGERRRATIPAAAASLHMSRSGNYIADWVMDVLPYHLGTIEQDVVVETTVDLNLQEEAEQARRRDARRGGREIRRRARARWWSSTAPARCAPWSAGAPTPKSQFNRAVEARRQPGSAFKPFVYLTAIEQLGYRPDTVMIDQPVTFGDWSPKNYDGKYPRPDDAEGGAGALDQHRRGAARRPGRRRRRWCRPRSAWASTRRSRANPSIALGTSEVTLLELTGAYAPFANGGFAVLPFVVQRDPHAGRRRALRAHRLRASAASPRSRASR